MSDLWVVVRSRNDAWVIKETLEGLATQSLEHKLLILDNQSTDGTAEIGQHYADIFVTIPAGSYRPGKVLNQALELITGDLVVFINSDCTPQDPHCLEHLLRPFDEAAVGATFGRQLPRPDCYPIFVRDTEETYGDGSRQKYWRHCFSMACSAVRRSAWEPLRFREELGYSEDVDFTWRLRQAGGQIRYAPQAQVMHSHNYTVEEYARRQRGEGRADAQIFSWDPWNSSWPRYTGMPLVRQILGDWRFCAKRGEWEWLWRCIPYRVRGSLARRAGFLDKS